MESASSRAAEHRGYLGDLLRLWTCPSRFRKHSLFQCAMLVLYLCFPELFSGRMSIRTRYEALEPEIDVYSEVRTSIDGHKSTSSRFGGRIRA